MATAEPQSALDALLRASAAGTLEGVTFAADAVQFTDGTRFPRDMLLTTSVDQPYRLDVLCFLAQFASRYPGVVNAAAYLKEARSAGVATVAITDRARVLAFLTTEGEGAPTAKRPRRAAGAGAAHPAERGVDEFLPVPEDIRLRDLAQLHDRNSILLSRNKSLAGVLEILHTAMKSGPDARHKDAKAPVAPPPALKSSRYKEVQEQRFWQERLGTRDVDELGIDTNASFLADAVQPLPPGLAAPAPAPQPKAPTAPQHAQKAAPPAGAAGRAGGIKVKEGGIPIIIVPSGMGSQVLLNMFNAKPFLEDCAFIPWEQQKSAGVCKEATLEIKRRSGRAKPVVYQVIDKPPPKKSQDWARVVAVFVQGANWQFSDFPFKGASEGNLLSTFERVQAFFVRYDSEPVPDFVKKWSVRTLDLSKNARHSDRSIVEGFWQALDHSLQMKRSTLHF